MENVISTFDLEVLAKKYDIRIWFCKKTGRRWSFLVGAGEQRPLPSELILETEEYGFFVQGENFDLEALLADVKKLQAKAEVTVA